MDQLAVEADAVIGDQQEDRIRAARQIDPGVPGAAVLDGISQPLLDEAIQAHGRVQRDRGRHLTVGEFDRQSVSLGQLAAEATDGRDEPQLLQLRRMQPVRQAVHRGGQLPRSGQQSLQAPAELGRRCRGVLSEELHLHGQEGKAAGLSTFFHRPIGQISPILMEDSRKAPLD